MFRPNMFLERPEVRKRPERLVFFAERLKRHYLLGAAVYLNIIAIHNDRKVGKPVFARKHNRFPVISLLMLAVRSNAIDAMLCAVKPPRKRHADCLRKTRSKRSGSGFNPGKRASMRMSLKPRI